ncbi:MAG: bifunctional 5,10-methylenetetrahydrofolate dehydrogenase/5,10-methenyltetrahydrofolate cyclohydrolase [bacterium]|nr:bifunctional 5,10-methylenetetrahydrofolate dehydrogenase/5,10-methenyltetrahydrofolate cyclohydrolase [bacterium]
MVIDGKAIAENIYQDLAPKFKAFGRGVRLGIVVVGENPVIESFVRIKTRSAEKLAIEMVRTNLPDTATTDDVVAAVKRMCEETDAVIAQLPLPKEVDTNAVLASIPKEKDVDALNPTVPEEERPVHAPVALAAVEILNRSGVKIPGARAVVVGAGRLVGAPSAWLLRKLGANVSVFSLEEGSIHDLKDADIIVSGAGNPGFIKPEHIKESVALVDGGTSELNKKIAGDADPACAQIAGVFTPVPGGVGPVAVAMIFKNLLELVGKAQN